MTMHHPDKDELVLVDEKDNVIGSMDKLQAHAEGRLHRCVSIQVFDSQGHWLLQRRANGKYHSPGLWSNTCCGHQRPGEGDLEAANRRLKHEMGFECDLEHIGTFQYQTDFPDVGLKEHEMDYVFVGQWDGTPEPNDIEVGEFKWVTKDELADLMKEAPWDFTYWFRKYIVRFIESKTGR